MGQWAQIEFVQLQQQQQNVTFQNIDSRLELGIGQDHKCLTGKG